MGYILDNANATRIQKALDESKTTPIILQEAIADLDWWCWERAGDEDCVHFWDIKGSHDTRFYIAPDGTWELQKHWGAWSPGRCRNCDKTQKFSNNGYEGKKREEIEEEFE